MDFSIDRWYSVAEITEYLGVSRDTVLNWIADKKIPIYKDCIFWKFKASEVDKYIRTSASM